MLKVNYCYHAGFVVETDNAVMIFNYSGGSIKSINSRKPLYIFISSCSSDHFDNGVFRLGGSRENIYYLVCKDKFSKKFKMKFFFDHALEKEKRKRITWTEPNQTYKIEGVTIRTFSSTDNNGSVAYLVETSSGNIFHAGYLTNWSWPTEPDENNIKSQKLFEAEVQKIRGTRIDVAFLILNPLQEVMYADGFDYFMRKLDIREVYPMNFKDDKKIIDFLINDPVSEPYRDKIKHTTEYAKR